MRPRGRDRGETRIAPGNLDGDDLVDVAGLVPFTPFTGRPPLGVVFDLIGE